MLDTELVREQFALFSGLEEGLLDDWQPICDSAIATIERRMKREPTPDEKDLQRLACAAAALAWQNTLLIRQASGGKEEIRVGDITLRSGGSATFQTVSLLVESILEGVADLLDPAVQVLRGVGE